MALLDDIKAALAANAELAARRVGISEECPEGVRDHEAIAQAVSAGRVRVVSHIGGIGTVLDALGADEGAALLDQLEQVAQTRSAVKWALKMVEAGTLDYGLKSTRDMITELVPDPARSKLLALAEVPDPITEFDVRRAIWADNGECLL